MNKKLILLFAFITLGISSYATHNRAGYIEYSAVPGSNCLTYNFTIITYTRTSSLADRDSLPLVWGDNTTDMVKRDHKSALDPVYYPDISINVYYTSHTFPAPGTYSISVLDPNRNMGVVNIPNSVNVPFFIETTLTISPYLACDNSPIILNPPIDKGCVGTPFYYTPNAYDPDGDSLSYVLVPCRGAGGVDIPGYTYPAANITFALNPTTGLLTWDSPEAIGEYNVAMLIISWRNGKKIGEVTLDMQIVISNCKNHPPTLDHLPDTCVLAGSSVHYVVSAHDTVDRDMIYLYASGGPLTFDPNDCAFNSQGVHNYSNVTGYFDWNTGCDDVRKQPYQISFTAQDNDHLDIPPIVLVAMENVNITVIAPAPQNLTASPTGNEISLTWKESPCPQASGYNIYRRNGFFSGTIQCPCQTGVPASTGFVLVATVKGLTDTAYLDNNNGIGLTHGVDYCYMVVATFPDGSESCASNQACAVLKKDSPIITNVSILTTNSSSGSIYVAWSYPSQLDTGQYKPPYRYYIYRSNSFTGNTGFSLVDSVGFAGGLNDTTYFDTIHPPLNTSDYPWSYRIDLYSNNAFVDKSQPASSVYLNISPTNHQLNLSWSEVVPWIDSAFVVYRQNHFTNNWDSIGYTQTNSFSDNGLANDTVYCYYVKSAGYYSQSGFVYPILNNSEQKCAAAVDNVFPCSPNLAVNSVCIAHVDSLIWNNPNYTCASGVIEYKVYIDTSYSSDTGTFKLLATITNLTDTTFIYSNPYSIAGCFKVTALDSSLNETQIANIVCVDNCPDYTLPNIFTPNGDGLNDYFHPFPYSFVKDIDIEIFDRWGVLMFQTSNPDINWDGTNSKTKGLCPDGVYFYICKVHEIHYNGIKTVTLKGDIELIREKK